MLGEGASCRLCSPGRAVGQMWWRFPVAQHISTVLSQQRHGTSEKPLKSNKKKWFNVNLNNCVHFSGFNYLQHGNRRRQDVGYEQTGTAFNVTMLFCMLRWYFEFSLDLLTCVCLVQLVVDDSVAVTPFYLLLGKHRQQQEKPNTPNPVTDKPLQPQGSVTIKEVRPPA